MWNKQETSTGIWYNTPTTLGNISETTFCCIQKGLKHLGEILPSESDKCTTKRINWETHSHPIWFWVFLRIKWNTKYSVFLMRGTNHINITNEHTHIKQTNYNRLKKTSIMSYPKDRIQAGAIEPVLATDDCPQLRHESLDIATKGPEQISCLFNTFPQFDQFEKQQVNKDEVSLNGIAPYFSLKIPLKFSFCVDPLMFVIQWRSSEVLRCPHCPVGIKVIST